MPMRASIHNLRRSPVLLAAFSAASAIIGVALIRRARRRHREQCAIDALACRVQVKPSALLEAHALDLTGFQLEDGSDGLAISAIVRESSALTELYLWNNRFTRVTAGTLANSLRRNKCVRRLWLSRNPLADPGVQRLASALMANRDLRDLRLARCDMTCVGATSLALALKAGLRLMELHLSANKIAAAGAIAIAQALPQCATLEFLALNSNSIDEEGALAIGEVLPMATVVELWLGANPLGDKGATAVAEGALGGPVERLSLVDAGLSEDGIAALQQHHVWSSGFRCLSI